MSKPVTYISSCSCRKASPWGAIISPWRILRTTLNFLFRMTTCPDPGQVVITLSLQESTASADGRCTMSRFAIILDVNVFRLCVVLIFILQSHTAQCNLVEKLFAQFCVILKKCIFSRETWQNNIHLNYKK